jgi:hypothetical protein
VAGIAEVVFQKPCLCTGCKVFDKLASDLATLGLAKNPGVFNSCLEGWTAKTFWVEICAAPGDAPFKIK